MKTIFRKELKDVLRWTPLGMIVIGLLCWQSIPRDIQECENVSEQLAAMTLIGSSLFALALGLLQSLFDIRTHARTFLLHRPISILNIFRGKLAAGFVVHLLAWGIPMLCVAIYLNSVGPEKLPVTWTYVLLPAFCCMVSFLFHPAAMWMACREARWLGTKCLPLILPCIAISAAMLIPNSATWERWRMLFPIVTTLAITCIIIIAAARHAFTHQTCLPAVSSDESWSWSNGVALTAASILAFVTSTFFVLSFAKLFQHDSPVIRRQLAMSLEGQLWDLKQTWNPVQTLGEEPKPPHLTGHQLTDQPDLNNAYEDLDQPWQGRPIAVLTPPGPVPSRFIEKYVRLSWSSSLNGRGGASLFKHRNNLHMYGHSGWRGTLTPQGIFPPNEPPQGTFNNVTTLGSHSRRSIYSQALGGNRIIGDNNGIYQLDIDGWQLRNLSETPGRRLAITVPTDHVSETWLWVRNEHTVNRFAVKPLTEGLELPSSDAELVKATSRYPLVNIQLTPAGEWQLDWLEDSEHTTLLVASASDKSVAFVTESPSDNRTFRFVDINGTVQTSGDLPDKEQRLTPLPPGTFTAPPGMVVGMTLVAPLMKPGSMGPLPKSAGPWMLIALHAAVSVIGTLLLVRSRVASIRSRLAWMAFGAIAGVGTWLAVIAVYPRTVLERCAGCERRRRVDRDRCEHCGAEWELPDSEGISLVGPRHRDSLTPQHAV